MKKIINGKIYDTDTARELGSWSNTGDYRDFHWVHEALYVKRTGEYFLYGEGGPLTQYARTIGQNEWCGGEMISPMTVENARQWAEERLDADEYAEIFGMPDEGTDEKDTLCIQIPADVSAMARKRAAEQEISLSAYVANALREAAK